MTKNNIKSDFERDKFGLFTSQLEYLIKQSKNKVERDKEWLEEAKHYEGGSQEIEELECALVNSKWELENLMSLSNKFWKCFYN